MLEFGFKLDSAGHTFMCARAHINTHTHTYNQSPLLQNSTRVPTFGKYCSSNRGISVQLVCNEDLHVCPSLIFVEGNVKVKFTLEMTTKAQRENIGIALLLLYPRR